MNDLDSSSIPMRALVHPRYGSAGVLTLERVPRPTPRDEEVLVQVHAVNVSIGDHHVVTGKPYLVRLTPYGGLPRPRNPVPGTAFAGRVVAVGARVTDVKPGDDVYGEADHGAFAEYLAVPVARVAPKPPSLTFEEAAATPWGVTALQALRDAGGLKAGHRVLVHGASGGVGTWAIQIARAFGAEVTAVCSTRHVERLRELGASDVIDYTKSDFAEGGAQYDVFLDLVGNRSLADCRRVVKPGGTYVACSARGGDWFGPLFRLLALAVTSLFSSRKLTTVYAAPNRADLLVMNELVESGRVRPVIEQQCELRELPSALDRVGQGHNRGQTVARIVPDREASAFVMG